MFAVSFQFGVLQQYAFCDDDRYTLQIRANNGTGVCRLDDRCVFQTVSPWILTRYHGGCMQQACERWGTLVPLSKRISTLLGEYGIGRLLSYFDVDQILFYSHSLKVVRSILMRGTPWDCFHPNLIIASCRELKSVLLWPIKLRRYLYPCGGTRQLFERSRLGDKICEWRDKYCSAIVEFLLTCWRSSHFAKQSLKWQHKVTNPQCGV